MQTPSRLMRWIALTPEAWRDDLLRIVLRVAVTLSAIVYFPSVILALKNGMTGVVVLDTAAFFAICLLALLKGLTVKARAIATCSVTYALGAGLMITVGSISQSYLFSFSLLTTLLLSVRWGIGTVVLNTVTMLAIGYVGIASPEMVVPNWKVDFIGWSVITTNFVLLNASLVLALGAVIGALEGALGRSVVAREALEQESRELVKLNKALEQEVSERARSEASLRESRALLRIAGLTARLGGFRIDLRTRQVSWSDEVCELYEVEPGVLRDLGQVLAFYLPTWRAPIEGAIDRCASDATPFDIEAEVVTAKGTPLWVRSIGNALRDAAGAISHVHGSIQDITPLKRAQRAHDKLEEQLRQAQKMETIGNLAGGVAHDFNNLMSIVLGYSEMLVTELPEGDPMRDDLEEIRKAGRRAVELTRQLLAFSRKQVLAPEILDLAGVVEGMEKMLQRLIGEDVELTAACPRGLGDVLVDPGQIEQVIMNLAVNARDAMPHGGKLTIEMALADLDEAYAAEHVGVTPGRYVMLAVSDTGTGMDAATQACIFEPFFTTKELGKGTGLGLSTVFGIVRQSGGSIFLYSEPGKGATFKVYLPIAETIASQSMLPASSRDATGGSETILVVEDEEGVRAIARTILTKHGYEVIEAPSAQEALRICDQRPATIHLLLTDVVMPRMSGRELVERLRPMRPAMKVIYMSGYTDDAVVRHGVLDSTVAFLQKPFTPRTLARKVRDVLDAPAPPSSGRAREGLAEV